MFNFQVTNPLFVLSQYHVGYTDTYTHACVRTHKHTHTHKYRQTGMTTLWLQLITATIIMSAWPIGMT